MMPRGQIDRQIDICIEGQIFKWIDGQMDNVQMDRSSNGQMDR